MRGDVVAPPVSLSSYRMSRLRMLLSFRWSAVLMKAWRVDTSLFVWYKNSGAIVLSTLYSAPNVTLYVSEYVEYENSRLSLLVVTPSFIKIKPRPSPVKSPV